MPPPPVESYHKHTRGGMTELYTAGYDCPLTTLEYGVLATVE